MTKRVALIFCVVYELYILPNCFTCWVKQLLFLRKVDSFNTWEVQSLMMTIWRTWNEHRTKLSPDVKKCTIEVHKTIASFRNFVSPSIIGRAPVWYCTSFKAWMKLCPIRNICLFVCLFACLFPSLSRNYTVMRYYAARSGNFLPTFRNNLSVLSSRVKYFFTRATPCVIIHSSIYYSV
jgi:hypothetical protein